MKMVAPVKKGAKEKGSSLTVRLASANGTVRRKCIYRGCRGGAKAGGAEVGQPDIPPFPEGKSEGLFWEGMGPSGGRGAGGQVGEPLPAGGENDGGAAGDGGVPGSIPG